MIPLLIAKIYAVGMLILGVSYLLFPKNWTMLLSETRRKRYGALIMGAFSLPFALVIAIGHPVWIWNAVVLVTIGGWIMLLKSIIHLFFPDFTFKFWDFASNRMDKWHRQVAIIITVISLILIYCTFIEIPKIYF